VKEIWEQKNAQREAMAQMTTDRMSKLRARNQLVGTTLSEAEQLPKSDLIPLSDLETLLEFADWLLQRLPGIWNSASFENKQRLQNALFPEGVALSETGFGTDSTPLFFREFVPIPVEKGEMASPGGFEPPLPP
jgi:hypothetical protein